MKIIKIHLLKRENMMILVFFESLWSSDLGLASFLPMVAC